MLKKKNQAKGQEFDTELLILDDQVPQKNPLAFRNAEYTALATRLQNVMICNYSKSLLFKFPIEHGVNVSTQNRHSFEENYSGFIKHYPQLAKKVRFLDSEDRPNTKLTYLTFLNTAYSFLSFIEYHKLPFVFELYPGGGLEFYNTLSDHKLKKVFSSSFFKGVITTQPIIKKYLLENILCSEHCIHEILGVVPSVSLNSILPRKYFGLDKATLDISFVAMNYGFKGLGKGYDVVLGVARKICKNYDDVHFHIVGNWESTDIEQYSELTGKVTYYGKQDLSFFPSFFQSIDISLNPSRPFCGSTAFDGFPLGVDAGMCGVAMFNSDDLDMNRSYAGDEIEIIHPKISDVAKRITYYHDHPESLRVLAKKCSARTQAFCGLDVQIEKRIEVLSKYASLARSQATLNSVPDILPNVSNVKFDKKNDNKPHNQKKILYVIHGYPPRNHAGTENYSYSLAKEISTKKLNVAVFYPAIYENLEKTELDIKKIANHTAFEVKIKKLNHINNLFNEEIERIFIQTIEIFKPDIIHFQHTHIALPFALLTQSISLKIPTLITLHDFWYICPKTYMLNEDGTLCSGPTSPEKCAKCFLKNEYLTEIDDKKSFNYLTDLFSKRLEMSRLIFLNANLTTAPSKFLLEKYKEYVTFNKSLRVPLGLDVISKNLNKNIGGPTKFGFLGNITALKNVHGLIDSFSRTSGDASLHIYGKINDSEIFETLKNISLIDPRIIFHGGYTPNDLSKILSQIDIGVVPSFFENYPLVVREFLSAKIPVIASRVGGIPEIIKNNENGLLFDPLIKDDLLNTIQKIIDNPKLISEFSSQITPIKSIDQDASVWSEIYKSFTSNRCK